jgi:hypothetical protein
MLKCQTCVCDIVIKLLVSALPHWHVVLPDACGARRRCGGTRKGVRTKDMRISCSNKPASEFAAPISRISTSGVVTTGQWRVAFELCSRKSHVKHLKRACDREPAKGHNIYRLRSKISAGYTPRTKSIWWIATSKNSQNTRLTSLRMFSANGESEGGKDRKVRWALGAVRKDMKQRTHMLSWSTHTNIQSSVPLLLP